MNPRVPVTFVYGSRSWIDAGSGFEIQAQRPSSYVEVKTIPAAGHHVYADNHEGFNSAMKEISKIVDDEDDIVPSKHSGGGDAASSNEIDENYN